MKEHMSGRGKLIRATNAKCAAADELVAGAAEAPCAPLPKARLAQQKLL